MTMKEKLKEKVEKEKGKEALVKYLLSMPYHTKALAEIHYAMWDSENSAFTHTDLLLKASIDNKHSLYFSILYENNNNDFLSATTLFKSSSFSKTMNFLISYLQRDLPRVSKGSIVAYTQGLDTYFAKSRYVKRLREVINQMAYERIFP